MTATNAVLGTTGHNLARLDRINVWAMPYLLILVVGLGTVFIFYDIFDINVSFIQTCMDLVAGCTPKTAVNWLGAPVLLHLVAYAVGAVVFSSLADKVGRREMLMITMLVTGLGSLYNALAPDYTHFVIARTLTGLGIGGDIALVNVYLNEVSPKAGRAKYASLILVMAAIGASTATWLGLVLTTQPGEWPDGLTFAQASPEFSDGWRWMYGIGAILAVVALALRFRLPESPRWLLSKGRTVEAVPIIDEMERRAVRRGDELGPVPDNPQPPEPASPGYRELFRNPEYLRRALLLTAVWILAFTMVYGFGAGLTSLLTSASYTPAQAALVVAVGTLGYIAAEIIGFFLVERLERKHWLPVGAVVVTIGAICIGWGTSELALAFIGAVLVFFGYNLWFAPMYALTAESFPTRIRSGAFGLVEGLGHIGGGIGVFAIAHNVRYMPIGIALAIPCVCLAAAAVLVQFAARTRNRRLEEVSP